MEFSGMVAPSFQTRFVWKYCAEKFPKNRKYLQLLQIRYDLQTMPNVKNVCRIYEENCEYKTCQEYNNSMLC